MFSSREFPVPAYECDYRYLIENKSPCVNAVIKVAKSLRNPKNMSESAKHLSFQIGNIGSGTFYVKNSLIRIQKSTEVMKQSFEPATNTK